MAAFLTTAQQNKLKSFYPDITNWDFERYTYGVSKLDVGETAYKKISARGRKLLNSSQLDKISVGRKQSRVNLTTDVKNKIANFKQAPNLSFSLEQDQRGDADRTPRIRVRIRNAVSSYGGPKSFTFDASPEGFDQAVKKHNRLKSKVKKVRDASSIGLMSNQLKTDYTNLKKTYTDELVEWIKTNAKDEKYNTKGGVDKLFKDAFKEFNKGKYVQMPETGATGSDAWLKKNLFIKDGKFQLPRNYELLKGFGTGTGGYIGHTNLLKQFTAYQLLDKNPNFTTTMQDLTDFYTGEKTKTDFTQKELSRLQKFASDNNIGGSSTLGKFLATAGFNFKNKIFEFSKFKTVYESLANELKQPGVPEYRQNQIRTAMSRINRNKDTVLKQLKTEYPNLFRSQSMVLEHANPQAFAKTESFFPKNFRLKAQYAPSAFNQLKNINFDQEFVRLSSRFNNETDPVFKNDIRKNIEKLVKNFNDKTKVKGVGYLDDLDIQFGKDKIRVTDKAKLISDLTDQDTIQQVLKNTQHSNQYLKNYPDAKVRLNMSAKGSYPVKDLQLEVPTLKEVSQNPNLTKFFNNARADAVAGGQICELPIIKGKASGGAALKCVDAVEDALQNNPQKLAQEVNQLPYQEGPINKVKNAATKFLQSPMLRGAGKFGAIAAGGAVAAGLVKKFMNDDPTTFLSNEEQQKNMLIDMVTGQLDDTPEESPAVADAYLPALGGAAVAGTAAVAPSTIEAARSGALGAKKSGITKTALKTLGRGLSATTSPLGLLATEPLYIAGQVQQGDSLTDIATNPANYLGVAFAGPATDFATKGVSPMIAKTMRLGISPNVLKTVSRRFGLPGLALSAGISGYELFDDYRKKRGMFSEE
jgi:hypothetical protein